MSESLGEYIRRRLAEKGVESRVAAAAIGVTPTYFSRVTTGKVEKPGAEFCLKLAEFFGDPYIRVMRLAGWLPEAETDEDLIQEIHELARTDSLFKDLLRIYRDITSQEQKEAFLEMAKAALQVYRKRNGGRVNES